jgi:hypothetical protein
VAAKLSKNNPPGETFLTRPTFYKIMKTNVKKPGSASYFSIIAFLLWPMSPKQLQPIRVVAPSKFLK